MPQAPDRGEALERLLDRAHAALMAGDLMALSPLADAVDKLVSGLGRIDAATAGRLRQKADRNGGMLQAATRGIRAARSRIADILAEPALTTYDARGRKGSVGQVSGQVPKRF